MSKRGSYLGGHTVVNGGSGWFSKDQVIVKKAKKQKPPKTKPFVQATKPAPALSDMNLTQLMNERIHQQNVLRQQKFLINQIYRRIEEIDKAIANLKSE